MSSAYDPNFEFNAPKVRDGSAGGTGRASASAGVNER
jgi:hypothetical protein